MKHADRVRAVAQDPSASGRSALFASWARSLTRYKLDPLDTRPPLTLTAGELLEARAEVEPLLQAAGGTLDRLFQALGGSGCCVLFTDRHGIPVERRGACADDDTFRRWGLWPGAVWSEEAEGTNGIGTCLAEARPLLIHRDQHFFARNTGLSCAVAPIHDHRGRLAAALDVSSCRGDLTEGVARLIAAAVVDAARRIEARHFSGAFAGARMVVAPETEWSTGALLAVDSDDVIIGATNAARLACGITDDLLSRGLPARAILSPDQVSPKDLAHAERRVLQQALTQSSGNVSAAAKLLGLSRATLHRKMKLASLTREYTRDHL